MCKHGVYTTIVDFQMKIVYRRKIKNRKKKKKLKPDDFFQFITNKDFLELPDSLENIKRNNE